MKDLFHLLSLPTRDKQLNLNMNGVELGRLLLHRILCTLLIGRGNFRTKVAKLSQHSPK